MKLFWSIHFAHPPQDIGYLVRLLNLIDSDNKAMLIINENKDIVDIEGFTNNSPAIGSFADPTHVNINGAPNRILLDTDSWGFPNAKEIERLEKIIGDGTADEEGVIQREQLFYEQALGLEFRPPDDGERGAGGRREGAREAPHFLFHEQPRIGG